jgi:hypothetical protein
VTLFEYRVKLDNREEYRKDHREGRGYAVRFTMDFQEPPADGKPFHDGSLVVFTDDAGLTHAMLTRRQAAVLADIPGEGVIPYWCSWWSPDDAPLGTVGFRRHPVRPEGAFVNGIDGNGPALAYHLVMKPTL